MFSIKAILSGHRRQEYYKREGVKSIQVFSDTLTATVAGYVKGGIFILVHGMRIRVIKCDLTCGRGVNRVAGKNKIGGKVRSKTYSGERGEERWKPGWRPGSE